MRKTKRTKMKMKPKMRKKTMETVWKTWDIISKMPIHHGNKPKDSSHLDIMENALDLL